MYYSSGDENILYCCCINFGVVSSKVLVGQKLPGNCSGIAMQDCNVVMFRMYTSLIQSVGFCNPFFLPHQGVYL